MGSRPRRAPARPASRARRAARRGRPSLSAGFPSWGHFTARRRLVLSGFCAQDVLPRRPGIELGALGDRGVAAQPVVEHRAVGRQQLVGREIALAQPRQEALFAVRLGGGYIGLVRACEEDASGGLLELAYVAGPGVTARQVALERLEHEGGQLPARRTHGPLDDEPYQLTQLGRGFAQPLPQRWHLQHIGTEAVVEVFAKPA